MLTKTEAALILIAVAAFPVGVWVGHLLHRLKTDTRGLVRGALDDLTWARRNLARPFRAAARWALENLDRYLPVLKTRTGAGLIVTKVAGVVALLLPSLPITDQHIEHAITAIVALALVAGFLRGLYGRRHAGGEVRPITHDKPPEGGPRASHDLNAGVAQ